MRLPRDIPPALDRFRPVLDVLGPGRRRGAAYWYVHCPAHDDDTPSLALWLGRDGRLMFGCHAGCPKVAILKAAGLSWGDVMPGAEHKQHRQRLVACYDYRDEAGRVLYQTVRYEPKTFRQRRPLPGGGWAWDLEGVRRVLYRLPELTRADPSATVLCVEGERDCDTAARLGLLATTNVGGARAEWADEYSEALSGRHVVVIPDADGPGRRHAYEVAGSLLAHDAASVRLAGLPAKDLTAFVTQLRPGHEYARRALVAALADAAQYRPARRREVG